VSAALPLVSVVIPTYNRAATIGASLESVFRQDYPNLEIIVVDDGSKDDTGRVMEPYVAKGVRYLRQENRGAPAARNAGVERASGELIAFLDSDDAWEPNKISAQVRCLRESFPETALVYTGMKKVDQNGALLGYKTPSKRGSIYIDLLKDNVVGSTSTALVKASVVREVGGFDTALRSRQDLDLWLRIAKKYSIDYVADPLVIYSVHTDRISSNMDSKIQGSERVLDKYFDDIRKHPSILSEHYYLLGWLYRKKGDRATARSYFRKAATAAFNAKAAVRYLESFFS
jgi:glycosyltransferase involved in cell wall biosynthesis